MERRITLTIVTSEDGKRCGIDCAHLSPRWFGHTLDINQCLRFGNLGTSTRGIGPHRDLMCIRSETEPNQPARGGHE